MRLLILLLALSLPVVAMAQGVAPPTSGGGEAFDGDLDGDDLIDTSDGLVTIDDPVEMTEGVAWSGVETIASVDSLDASNYLVLLDASGGDFALTLPAASLIAGRAYVLAMAGATGTVTLTPAGIDTIEGAASVALTGQHLVFGVYSDGVSDWKIQAEGFVPDPIVPVDGSQNITGSLVASTFLQAAYGTFTTGTTAMYLQTTTADTSQPTLVIRDTQGSNMLLWDVNPVDGNGPGFKGDNSGIDGIQLLNRGGSGVYLYCNETTCDLGWSNAPWDQVYVENLTLRNGTITDSNGAVIVSDADGLDVSAGTLFTDTIDDTGAGLLTIATPVDVSGGRVTQDGAFATLYHDWTTATPTTITVADSVTCYQVPLATAGQATGLVADTTGFEIDVPASGYAGVYGISGGLSFQKVAGTAAVLHLHLTINGANAPCAPAYRTATSTGWGWASTPVCHVALANSDTVEICVQNLTNTDNVEVSSGTISASYSGE